jgi:hypothetical protein
MRTLNLLLLLIPLTLRGVPEYTFTILDLSSDYSYTGAHINDLGQVAGLRTADSSGLEAIEFFDGNTKTTAILEPVGGSIDDKFYLNQAGDIIAEVFAPATGQRVDLFDGSSIQTVLTAPAGGNLRLPRLNDHGQVAAISIPDTGVATIEYFNGSAGQTAITNTAVGAFYSLALDNGGNIFAGSHQDPLSQNPNEVFYSSGFTTSQVKVFESPDGQLSSRTSLKVNGNGVGYFVDVNQTDDTWDLYTASGLAAQKIYSVAADTVGDPRANDSGQFILNLGTLGTFSYYSSGVALVDSSGSSQVLFSGANVTTSQPVINELGQVAHVFEEETAIFYNDVLLYDGLSTQVALEGDDAISFENPMLNDLGWLLAESFDISTIASGFAVYDGTSQNIILTDDDSIDGYGISLLENFTFSSTLYDFEYNTFNNHGQFVFGALLDTDNDGTFDSNALVRADPMAIPEPAGALTFGLAGLALLFYRSLRSWRR